MNRHATRPWLQVASFELEVLGLLVRGVAGAAVLARLGWGSGLGLRLGLGRVG